MVSCREAWKQVRDRLCAAQVPEPEADANLLLELAAGSGWRWRDAALTQPELDRLQSWTQKREERWPIQYILGHWTFLDLELQVGPGVLTPRADTEVVCEAAAEKLAGQTVPKILDLCAGSGALGLGLKRLIPGADVTLLEKSPEAFCYLKKNCTIPVLLKQPPEPKPVQGDLFEYHRQLEPECFDLIVSNPPYLTGKEMNELQPEVAFEPAMALDGGTDGLEFYRQIAREYAFAVRHGGWLVVEIGWQQRESVQKIFAENGWVNISGTQDYDGKDRAVWAQRP